MARVDLLQDKSEPRPKGSAGPINKAQIVKIALVFVLLGAAAIILYPQIASESATPGLPIADSVTDLAPQPTTAQVVVPPPSHAGLSSKEPQASGKGDTLEVSANEPHIVGGPRAAPK